MFGVALRVGQCRDVDLHSVSSFGTVTVVRGVGFDGYTCRNLAGPGGQPDTNNNQIKCDGDNGHGLVASNRWFSNTISISERMMISHHI